MLDDLGCEGMDESRACATAVRLLDLGYFRIGNDVYADENGSFGLTTLERRHVRKQGDRLVFAFTGKSEQRPAHYEALGPSAMVKAARLVDQELREVSQSFDFVLQTVPLNTNAAWEEFKADRYKVEPVFYYRPLPYDPAQLKRRLFAIPIDRIEDATLIHLFAEKQDHIDRQLTALKNIDAPPFFYDSVQLYGVPDADLVKLLESPRTTIFGRRSSAATHGPR